MARRSERKDKHEWMKEEDEIPLNIRMTTVLARVHIYTVKQSRKLRKLYIYLVASNKITMNIKLNVCAPV